MNRLAGAKHYVILILDCLPDKKSVAKACCWSRGRTSPCGSGRNTGASPPDVSLQPAHDTTQIDEDFTKQLFRRKLSHTNLSPRNKGRTFTPTLTFQKVKLPFSVCS